ncbi:hypothetical protein FIBSPDRAFT_364550 [Athelia psychrophila]|uniref:Uncharacterized protein n=1 Tax=Athelia psychrophila TaxID=1759441 RepID=A0A166PGY7_9AGAM|nr:hypothetical protein FIBSPDRAFT_364550 [Fibularhizoctonia sp. CBS 109695]
MCASRFRFLLSPFCCIPLAALFSLSLPFDSRYSRFQTTTRRPTVLPNPHVAHASCPVHRSLFADHRGGRGRVREGRLIGRTSHSNSPQLNPDPAGPARPSCLEPNVARARLATWDIGRRSHM